MPEFRLLGLNGYIIDSASNNSNRSYQEYDQ